LNENGADGSTRMSALLLNEARSTNGRRPQDDFNRFYWTVLGRQPAATRSISANLLFFHAVWRAEILNPQHPTGPLIWYTSPRRLDPRAAAAATGTGAH